MKFKSLLVFGLFSLGLSVQSYAQYYLTDTAKLNQAYRVLQKTAGAAAQKTFFEAFPSTWQEFIQTFLCPIGRNTDHTKCQMVGDYLATLEGLSQIPDSAYCNKLIGLSIGGEYGADAPHALQEIVRQYIKKKTEIVFSQLSTLKRGEQLRFWLFVWHTMLKKGLTQEFEYIKNKMVKIRPEEVRIMEIGFEFSWGEAHWPPK
jgi:hypothetical protein